MPTQPVAAGAAPFGPGPCVADGELERGRRPREADGRRGAGRVLADVGERLLQDPVGGQVERGRQRSRIAVGPQLDRDAGRARVLDQRRQLRQPRLRAVLGSLVALAQDAEHAAHLAERLVRRAADRPQRLARPRRVLLERGLGGVGLHGDHADAVGDHVMQLASDPRALLGHGDPLRGRALAPHQPPDRARRDRPRGAS